MPSQTKISFVLSFIAGFVDTAGFIALFGIFTAHITGNLVLAGTVLFNEGTTGNLAGKLLMIPVFMASVLFSGYIIKYRKASVRHLVLAESVFLTCFALAGSYLLYNKANPPDGVVALVASFAVIGMAIQTTYMREQLGGYTPSTVMTGNITQFSIDLFNIADYHLSKKAKNTEDEKATVRSLQKISTALTGFSTGCVSGAFLVKYTGLICCILPAFLLLWVFKQMKFKTQQENISTKTIKTGSV
ncbi:MAG: YoaK family protein [Chitinophagaceae bacterium]